MKITAELRNRIHVFLDELSAWDNSVDPSEALYDLTKFCRIRNEDNEDVRHYFLKLIDILDGKTDVMFFQDGVNEMKQKTLSLMNDIDVELKMAPIKVYHVTEDKFDHLTTTDIGEVMEFLEEQNGEVGDNSNFMVSIKWMTKGEFDNM
jgi:hypothetical protein